MLHFLVDSPTNSSVSVVGLVDLTALLFRLFILDVSLEKVHGSVLSRRSGLAV